MARKNHDAPPAGDGGPPDAEPTRDQLLAMAFADGELGTAERVAFEARLAAEPALAREVAQHRALDVLARRLAPPEPADHEWRRLAAEPLQRGTSALAWAALVVGAIGLVVVAAWKLVTDASIDPVERGLIAALLVGVLLLFLTALRGRLRTYHLDPYRNVER